MALIHGATPPDLLINRNRRRCLPPRKGRFGSRGSEDRHATVQSHGSCGVPRHLAPNFREVGGHRRWTSLLQTWWVSALRPVELRRLDCIKAPPKHLRSRINAQRVCRLHLVQLLSVRMELASGEAPRSTTVSLNFSPQNRHWAVLMAHVLPRKNCSICSRVTVMGSSPAWTRRYQSTVH